MFKIPLFSLNLILKFGFFEKGIRNPIFDFDGRVFCKETY